MSILFSDKIIIKEFNNSSCNIGYHKCKDFDGPNNFSIFWNQLLILALNDKIKNKIDLLERFNQEILKLYKNDILNQIDIILYKFLDLKLNSITLYYDKYNIKNDKNIIEKLTNLYKLIDV